MIGEFADSVLAAPARLGAVRLVAVDGPSGSGKSTFAAALVTALGERAAVVSTDDFATWDDPVAWWPRLVSGVLAPLREGVPGRYQRTRWLDGTPAPGEWVDVAVPAVLVVEGVSAGRRSVGPLLSRLFWCELPDPAARLARSVARDGERSRAVLTRWQAFEAGWFAVDGTRERASAHVVV
ncbi:uridine kinase family protein [Actinokineospora iranica]|uniref:Uridine kinase n=1 Tax=Actinokineospora iranica TaxID=1271860 RepID=A0A1G6Y8N9_9PSEU|nr:hypothetical protein [Actinokineospora iranica]SDD85946.1 hypothetical protein SAMN05216174_12050 [Actinokineospora iranica]